jgi:acetyl esterase/lipase
MLTVFRPEKSADTGVAVIVCPGGGYTALMMDYEGEDVARWLNTVGITGIVLKYRIATPTDQPKWTLGVRDGQRAISLVRSKAKEWGLKEDKIGILGFSAGGHLAIAASCNFEKRTYESVDEIDKVSCRPDFAIPIYPGGNVKDGQLTPECKPGANAPPTFMAISTSDRIDNVLAYYKALAEAKVPAEAHFYATGKHGFGIKPSGEPHSDWPVRCLEWMRGQKLLEDLGHH